jgi:hypothetical protein
MARGQFDGIMYNSGIDGEDTEPERYAIDANEQIRIAALNAAIAYTADHRNRTMANIEQYANAFDEFIRTGSMPDAPAGVIW